MKKYRDIVTIDDLSLDEMETLFKLADEYLGELTEINDNAGVNVKKVKITGRLADFKNLILATLFYEPSTRTRCSFESAMLRLGGHVITSDNPATTSAAKGETLADTIRVMENYCDIIVLRHPLEGAARVASDFSSVPIINGGDGGHEHPTQTLCDLYTLRREKGSNSLRGLNVLLRGDLKNGRTVHSLVFALARFGANILTSPAPGLELPVHVRSRLEQELNCRPWPVKDLRHGDAPAELFDVIYISDNDHPDKDRLFPSGDDSRKYTGRIDAYYVTRLQKERLAANSDATYKLSINSKTLKAPRYKNTSILHPLPRVDELGYDLDADPRGAYFRQAAYGVVVRMALLSMLYGIRTKRLNPAELPNKQALVIDCKALRCSNLRCISNCETESKHLAPQFKLFLADRVGMRLNCAFCDHEATPAIAANPHSRHYYSTTMLSKLKKLDWKNIIFFMDEEQAKNAGYVPANKYAEVIKTE